MVLIGRITKDAVIKQLKDERKFVVFTLAINDYYKPKGASKGVTIATFYNCSYWISTKIVERLTKGSLVEISGRIYVSPYMGLDGEAKASLTCHVNSITIHQIRKSKNDQQAEAKETHKNDLPF